jgi:exopolysaccharide biosynthesis WecB/TagA/CpsF family protein
VIGGDVQLLERLAAQNPARQWHHHMPPMGVRTDHQAQSDIIDFVEECDADVFFFAIGAPQSELLCAQICSRGKASGIALCIGASLEFLAGIKRRAPRWMQVLALEWLFRLITEPGRLWRRYLLEGPAVFRIWWRYRISGDHRRVGCDSSEPDGR